MKQSCRNDQRVSSSLLQDMSNFDSSTHSRPYTVGFSIAAVLIFFIAIFHFWKFVLKKFKKWLNSSQPHLEPLEEEIPPSQNYERKLSSVCVKQLEMILEYEDEPSDIKVRHTQAPPFTRSLSGRYLNLIRSRLMNDPDLVATYINKYAINSQTVLGEYNSSSPNLWNGKVIQSATKNFENLLHLKVHEKSLSLLDIVINMLMTRRGCKN